jgi:uncharacterized protein (DUF58 family)
MTGRGVTKGAYVIAGIGGALYFAARTTGAGWLLVILCALAGVLFVGCVWPRIGLARVRIAAGALHDATVGEPFVLTLRVTRAGLGVRILPASLAGQPTAAVGDTETTTEVVPDRRGVIDTIQVELASAAPFGLVWWRRRMTVDIDRAIEIAPRAGDTNLPSPPGGALGDVAPTSAGTGGDQVRGVRDYTPGDPLRHVHWPATARLGGVMVKEFEQPERPRLELVVDLRGPATAAEHAAERAMGVVCDALAQGIDVTLCTAEAGGPRRAVVTSRLEAGRRLARATAGPLPVASPGESTVVISGTQHAR